jgi:HupE / UreJ protein
LQKTSSEIGDPPMNALLDGPPDVLAKKLEESRVYFLANIKVQTDHGPGLVTHLQFPTLEDVNEWKASGRKPRLPVVALVEVDGTLPDDASVVRFQFPTSMETVVLTVNRPGDEAYDEPINAGSVSSFIPIRLEGSVGAKPAFHAAPVSRVQIWLRYVLMGISHIIPEGTDHICFILGLFLASRRLSFLLWQVTAFTLAHSITLALSLYGVIQLPAYIVEPCIAASIVFIGIENLRGAEVGYRRLFVVLDLALFTDWVSPVRSGKRDYPNRIFLVH